MDKYMQLAKSPKSKWKQIRKKIDVADSTSSVADLRGKWITKFVIKTTFSFMVHAKSLRIEFNTHSVVIRQSGLRGTNDKGMP